MITENLIIADDLAELLTACSFLFLILLACCLANLISDVFICFFKNIHCHRIMKSGKKHKCTYWTCPHYTSCPYNSNNADERLKRLLDKYEKD